MKKTAYWMRRTHLFRADEYICSVCRAVCGKPFQECPVCGSRMGKTRHDPSWVDEAEMTSALMDDDW